jgi:hypothetical protein
MGHTPPKPKLTGWVYVQCFSYSPLLHPLAQTDREWTSVEGSGRVLLIRIA